jgi:hypothetical protein
MRIERKTPVFDRALDCAATAIGFVIHVETKYPCRLKCRGICAI